MQDDPNELVDFRDLKDNARDILPPGDPVREAMLREPDFMPRQEMRAKIHTYARLLIALRRKS